MVAKLAGSLVIWIPEGVHYPQDGPSGMFVPTDDLLALCIEVGKSSADCEIIGAIPDQGVADAAWQAVAHEIFVACGLSLSDPAPVGALDAD